MLLLLCAKIDTKGIDGFVKAILFLIGRALECNKLVMKFSDGFLEIRCVRWTWITANRLGTREAWCQQTYSSSFAVSEGLHVVT